MGIRDFLGCLFSYKSLFHAERRTERRPELC